MIHELDQTLSNILDDADAPEILRNADVSFLVPDNTFGVTSETINLYLYDVHENRMLRDPLPRIVRTGDSYIKRMPPLRVDCSYMVTSWSPKNNKEEKVHNEHQLLSLSLLWLSRFPVIPEKFFPDSWKNESKDSYQPYPPPMWVAQANGVKEPGEFWAALNQSPRPYFNLVITIAMDLWTMVAEGPLVTTKATTFGVREGVKERLIQESREHLIQIGGRVLDAAQPHRGVGGAIVSLVEIGQTETADDQGRFSFPGRAVKPAVVGLTAGNYTLRAIAQGYAPMQKSITVPGPPEEYEIALSPL